jgi:plastocyanin
MRNSTPHPERNAGTIALLAATMLVLAGTGYLLGACEVRAQAAAPAHAGMNMSEQGMARAVSGWFASHPTRGSATAAAPVDSFIASGFTYDRHGDPNAVDTAHVTQGDAVLFKWGSGSHTLTSGTGSTDPAVGALFDQPLASATPRFTYQFDTAGTFPFFCRLHEGFNMRGVVIVAAVTGVAAAGPAGGHEGFVRPPTPNPTRGVTTFQFALARPGRARVDVHDLQGRRVATVLDADFAAGSYRGAWDGRTATGARAPAGVYELRLSIPGASQSQGVTLLR